MIISFNTGKISSTGGGSTALQQKKVTVTENGLDVVVPDAGYDGLSTVYVKTYVTDASGKKDFSVLGYDDETSVELNEMMDKEITESVKYNKYSSVYLPKNTSLYDLGGSYKLRYIPDGTTLTRTTGYQLFKDCYSLSQIDLSKINITVGNDARYMFNNCFLLEDVIMAEGIFSNVVKYDYMFENAYSLKSIVFPKDFFDSCDYASNMFNNASKNAAEDIFLDFSEVNRFPTDMSGMFKYCWFDEIRGLDTSNSSKIANLFQSASFKTIGKLSLKSMTNDDSNALTGVFQNSSVVTFGGFVDCENVINWGVYASLQPFYYASSLTNVEEMGVIKTSLFLSTANKLTVDSLMVFINALYDYTGNGETPPDASKLVLGTTNLAKLTDEQIAIGVNKGWTITA